jgi:hypothetical protein
MSHKIFEMPFSKLYPLYVAKALKKQRTKEEVNQIIYWLTGYTDLQLKELIDQHKSVEFFFSQAPRINPNVKMIKGKICGVTIEDIEDPLMKKIRYLDKLIDELAKGKSMEKILRKQES